VRRNRIGQRGQSVLETALILPVFMFLLIGVLDVGQVLFVHQTLAERARNAVRYGVVRNYDSEAIRNMLLYNQPTVPQRPGAVPGEPVPGIFGLTPDMVQVTRHDANTHEDRVVVTLSNYPFQFYTPLIARVAIGKPITMSLSYETM